MAALVLALAQTWPLATRISTSFPAPGDTRVAHIDQLLIAWILASDARRLGEDPLHVFETNNMHPFRRTLAFSENLIGLAVPVWPAQALWDNPVLTANLALLFALTLSAYGVILLVHELTGSVAAALVAATFATYAPAVWAQIHHLHVVTGHCTALAFFALLRLVRTHAWRWAVALGVLAAWQVWASMHWGVFLALGLASAVPVLLATSREARRALPQLVVAAVVAAVLVLPLALPYAALVRDMDLQGGRRLIGHLRSPGAALPPFRDGLARLAARLGDGTREGGTATLAPYLAIAAGVLASLVVRRRRVMAPALLAAVAAGAFANFWLAIGGVKWLGIPNLYRVVAEVPGVGLLRMPARATAYVHLMLSVLAGCGVASMLRRLDSRPARAAVVAACLGLAVVEAGWRPGRLAAAPPLGRPVPPALADLPAGCAVAEAPSDLREPATALFRSTAHWRPLLNGYSGFSPVPPFAEAHFLNRFPDDASLAYLHAAGVCAVLVRFDRPAGTRMLERSLARGLRPRPLAPAYGAMLVPLGDPPPPPPAGAPLERAAWRVVEPPDGAPQVLDGSLATFRIFRVDGPGGRLDVDLGNEQQVAGVDVGLGAHFRRYLRTYRLEGSSDGVRWETLAEEPLAVPPFASYRADPTRIVQRIHFPAATVRYLRLGPFRRPPHGAIAPDVGFKTWGIAELDVLGPPGEHAPSPEAAPEPAA